MSSLFQRNIIRSVKKSKNKIILKSSFFWKNDRHIWANIKINIWHKRLTNTIQKKKKKKSSIKYSQFNLSNECRVRSNCSIETGICLSRKISRCSFQPLEKWIRENTDGGARFFCFICEIIYIFFSRESWPKKIRDESEINRGQAFENPSSKDLIPFFFFSAEFFLSSYYYYAYLSLGAGQLPPNLASFVRSLNEIPPHVPIARNGEDWIVLHNGLDSIKGERKRRFCNFHIR